MGPSRMEWLGGTLSRMWGPDQQRLCAMGALFPICRTDDLLLRWPAHELEARLLNVDKGGNQDPCRNPEELPRLRRATSSPRDQKRAEAALVFLKCTILTVNTIDEHPTTPGSH